MKRFLIPLLAAITLPTAVIASVDPKVHNLCKEVTDYMGCVKANSKKEAWKPFKKTTNKNTKKIEETTKVKKQRPEWMVQKLKGCFKYADEIQKNYCIKTYSPYGNPIPENLDINAFDETLSTVKSKKINCNSPVWKNKPACKGKTTSKITYIYNGKKFDSLSAIANNNPYSDIYSRDIFAKKNKRYVASTNCPTGTSMYWVSRGFFGKYNEMGCMTPGQFEFAKFQLTRGRGGGGGSYNANQYNDSYNRQQHLYRRIDNFNNTGSFDQPTFNFNTNTGGY